jgi:tRNA G10  N-methylase Trm11
MDFIFTLGYSEELALAELSAVLGSSPEKVTDHQYKATLPGLREMNYLANRLGGLVEVRDEGDKLVWRHSARDWFRRDRAKPYSDRRKGLLPPKIARILINLAVGTTDPEGKTLLDPFCGSGTLLLEAGVMKMKLLGNDLDQTQLAGARRNLDYFGLSANLLNYDATKLSEYLSEKVDFIATEPYMGRPGTREDRLPDLAKGLGKLYLGCLKDWDKFLVPHGRIAMIFPVFEYAGRTYPTSRVIDDPKLIGYNIVTRGLIYSRPDAKVRREIIILQKS